ncbi:ABC transporter ATP-binding protein [Granulosicoccus antarcticus]|uniref:Multidrug export ATP-binding/permease protein n=1 Tax=Granulosicoccus antarcticus IMCC3135 TaxID=1192854 RepID=A0A2Z2NZ67_9GAMM|nr:ABC transporter ATP-binding protein [Granulosicoccus antarcticus]ASJ73087.1 Putative multidrug export ATP-binding/permease protein [Granulosicoccus antarcticus IMCC3135]
MFTFFENLVDPYTEGPVGSESTTRVWPFIGAFTRPFRTIIALNIVTSFLVAAAEVGLLYYLGRIVDLLNESTPSEFWSANGLEISIVLALVVIFRPLVQILNTALIKNAIQPNIAALGRWRSYKHVLNQSVGWFENDFAGRIANRVCQMPAACGDLIFQVMDTLSFTVAYMIGASILLASSDPRLLIPLFLWFVLYIVLLRWSLKRIRPASRASSASRSRTLGFVVDSFSNIQSVKLFSHTARETEFAQGIFEDHRQTYAAETRIFTTIDAGLVLLNGFLIASVVGWALMIWSDGSATVGVVATAGALALRINSMSSWVMGSLTSFFRNLGVVSEGMESVAQPIGLLDKPDAPDLQLSEGGIKVVALSHHYGRESGGLNNVSFEIQAGEKVGLVGRSGSGKSTLVKALLRLYDPEQGQILFDDVDIGSVTQASLRAQIGMVQQENSLLHRSIKENLLYGRPGASDEQVISAAIQAEAHDFILDQCDSYGRTGYAAHVGERGVKLSGGQRQRIALARVILKDAPILILDEATSALDSEIEAQIQTTLYGMMRGKTVVAIAHRLSTIAQMDRILVLDKGCIVEQGSHQTLINQKGLYATLWQHQSGGFIDIE